MQRRMKSKVIAVAATATAVATVLAGCSDPTNPTDDKPSEPAAGGTTGELNLFMYQKPNGVFGPLASNSGPDNQVNTLIYDSLLYRTPDGELKPGAAAAEPEVSDGGKTITYKLKKDLTWNDGKPLTSKDLLFTYTRAADVNTASSKAAYLGNVEGVKEFSDGKAQTIAGFTAPDPQTFVIKQTVNAPALVGQISDIGILPEHILKDEPVKDFGTNKFFQAPTVTSGPFKFVEFKTDQYAHVQANEHFREKVGVKDVYVKPVAASVATQQLSTGEMDIAWISATDIETVKSFKNVKVVEQPSTGMVVMAWNQSQARFKNPKVKQGFLHAIDREGIVKSALLGHGSVRNSLWPEKWSGTDINTYAYDPAKAKQLLDEAGFDYSQPVTLAWIAGGNPDRDAAATAIEDQLNKIGVKLQLKQVQGSYFTDVFTSHKYDIILYGGGDYGVVPANAGPVSNCKTHVPVGPNTGLYCNPELDKAMAEASAQTDEAARKAAFEKAAKIENADPALGWLYSLNWNFGVSDRVQNFRVLDNATWFEPWRWTVKG